MTSLDLPALDGRSPLGFLAALGVLRLITENNHPAAKLAWSPVDCSAVLHDAQPCIDDLVADLIAIVEEIPAGGVLPGMPPNFPPLGEAPDKMRLPRVELRAYAQNQWTETGLAGERWIASLVTDLSVDEKGRADISCYTAPSGKQSMRTMFEKPLAFVRANPQVLREALVAWRRHPGVTGEYLDNAVLYDAADAPDGKSQERGVPGATWLALMAYPLLRTSASGGEPITTCWQRGPGKSQRSMIYPLWSEPLGTHGVVALLEHPVLRAASPGKSPPAADLLSVFIVCAAERRRIPGRTFAGVLTPIRAAPLGARSRAGSSARRQGRTHGH